MKSMDYTVHELPLSEILPSPENDDIYGGITSESVYDLAVSIRDRGLAEPIILSADHYIVSGHRRFRAIQELGWDRASIRFDQSLIHDGNPEWHRVLADYNPQRVKTAGSILKEALLKDESAEDFYDSIQRDRRASLSLEAEFTEVAGFKEMNPISEGRRPFLEAVQAVIEELRPYWPLQNRQIHYNLLNDPPLTMTAIRSKFGPEHNRYRNDERSYKALTRLLTDARYAGDIDMAVIDDPTRPQFTWGGFDDARDFIKQEVERFLCGYHRNRQQGQSRYIEVLGEKNTLMQILKPVCQDYYVPLSLGRGFCSLPVFRDMAKRFRESRCERMTLIVVSDLDPEGLELSDDAIRKLRDRFQIPIDYHRAGVTREQIDELNLAEDFSPAKVGSRNLKRFIKKTGGKSSWEVEALPPLFLQNQLRAAIEANMNMKIYDKVLAMEREDTNQIYAVRRSIASELALES